jgi:hypothetical protein
MFSADPLARDQGAELAKMAQRCLMTALDHSHAQRIALVDENGKLTNASVLALPPQALRFFADMLGMMAQQRRAIDGVCRNQSQVEAGNCGQLQKEPNCGSEI